MYRILGRRKIRGGRPGEFRVEFSLPWPEKARSIYLVSEFTSWFPGRIKLNKTDNRGKVVVHLWEGLYHYGFSINTDELITDPENPRRNIVKPFYDVNYRLELSVADVGFSDLRQKLNEKDVVHWEYVVHDEEDVRYFSQYLNTIVLRIRTLHEEFDEVFLEIINDDKVVEKVMLKVLNGPDFDYYEVSLPWNSKKISYRFKLLRDSKVYYFGYSGAHDKSFISRKTKKSLSKEPPWFLGASYYLIFVDSFDNANPENDPPMKIKRISPRERGYFGGDLEGIIRRLNHIKKLGVDAILLTPIFKALSYHRYDVIDYFTVDPFLGNEKDFIKLVKEAHKMGIKLVLDIPMHHTSICFNGFIDAILNGDNSLYWNWFNFTSENISNEIMKSVKEICSQEPFFKIYKRFEAPYETFLDNAFMPKLNHDEKDVIEFFKEVVRYWLDKGVDGFRIDVGHGIPENFMSQIYIAIKTFKENALVLGETTGDPTYYAKENLFDSLMNYEFRRLILRFFVDEEIDAYRFAQEISKLYIRLSPYHSTSIYNLLESHDTSRFITYAGRNIDKVIQSYAFMFISFGSPSIYYGGEIGLEGNDDPDNRRPMVWDVKHWDNALLSNIIKLIDLRRKFSVFRYGLFLIKPLGPKVVLVIRYLNDVQGYAIFNVGRREYQLHLGEMINLLYDYNTITKYSENGLDTIIGPNGVLVFTPKL